MQGIHCETAWKWFRDGTLPVPAIQTPTGAILVNPDVSAPTTGGLGLYARVSSHDQEADLDAQVARLAEWAAKTGAPVARVEASTTSMIRPYRAVLEGVSRRVHHTSFSAHFGLDNRIPRQQAVRRRSVADIHHSEHGQLPGRPPQSTKEQVRCSTGFFTGLSFSTSPATRTGCEYIGLVPRSSGGREVTEAGKPRRVVRPRIFPAGSPGGFRRAPSTVTAVQTDRTRRQMPDRTRRQMESAVH